mmetsp:Transcript_7774/g.23793  ORF Transcript_7774/g.23793 Transcript_7774/m.23793 type:complete len:218 (+) Transcript_7774:1045-1698(+)
MSTAGKAAMSTGRRRRAGRPTAAAAEVAAAAPAGNPKTAAIPACIPAMGTPALLASASVPNGAVEGACIVSAAGRRCWAAASRSYASAHSASASASAPASIAVRASSICTVSASGPAPAEGCSDGGSGMAARAAAGGYTLRAPNAGERRLLGGWCHGSLATGSLPSVSAASLFVCLLAPERRGVAALQFLAAALLVISSCWFCRALAVGLRSRPARM